ncbi:MAG: YitT family protein [Clostridia bacterium]|nr:YitT family protein [Clostridia bacterium]
MKDSKKLMTYIMIIGLAFVCALNYQLFVAPNSFAPSGLTGICTMIKHITGINIGYLSLMINVPLAMMAWRSISRSMAVRSMVYVISNSLALILLGSIDLSAFIYATENGTSTILGPLVAGVINGACFSLLAKYSASSGGIDFIAAVIRKHRPQQDFFWITFSINCCIAASSYFVFDFQIEPVILCIMFCFTASTVSDSLMKSGRSAIRCEIITEYPEEMSEAIITRLHRSATVVPAKGMYLGRETNILICIVNRDQLPVLSDIVKEYDDSFAVLSTANSVIGNFKQRDMNGRQKKELFDKGDAQIA